MAVSEEVYQRLLARGADRQAADRAMRLALEWAVRGDFQVATAWLARARRLLDDLPPCVQHGYLAYVEGALDLDMAGDPGPAAAASEQVQHLAREFDDPALESFALVLAGMAAVRAGETAAGFARLDEAMLPVLAGQVEPLWAGDVYCTVVHLCDELADLTRMRSWTDAMGRWSVPRSETFLYARVTRIHELQLAMAEGDWDTVEQELGGHSASLVGAHGWMAGEGYYTLGEVRRLRGDSEGAREAYALARDLGHDAQPGDSLLLLAEGRTEDALAALRIALADHDRLGRARILPVMIDLTLARGETAYAESLTAELESTAGWFGTAGLGARASQARAAVLVATGDPAAAIPHLERAARVYREQRHQHASAAVHERLAEAHRALGRADAAAAEDATARAIYTRLGAEPDLRRLAPRGNPGRLTDREVEVLRLVARGASNREVAGALTISAKTVSRHLANIFSKIDVATRTAAAGWARDHDL